MEAKLMRWVQRQGWDRASSCYERYWGGPLRPAIDGVLAAAALRSGEHVLDVACGTGLLALPAAEAVGPTGRVVATDLAPQMIASLTRRAEAAGLANVDTVIADAETPPDTGRFDVVLCGLGLMYVPDPGAALTGMLRALRPGGRIVASVWGERRRCGWSGIFPIVDARVRSDVCPLFFALGGPGVLRAAMQSAGFMDVVDQRLPVELYWPTAADAVGAAFDGGPVALAAARFAADVRATAHEEYLASIAPYAAGSGYRVPGEFVLATGRRP